MLCFQILPDICPWFLLNLASNPFLLFSFSFGAEEAFRRCNVCQYSQMAEKPAVAFPIMVALGRLDEEAGKLLRGGFFGCGQCFLPIPK